MSNSSSGRKKNKAHFNLQFFGGFRGHLGEDKITWHTIQKDYASEGKIINEAYAKEVHSAIKDYTGDEYEYMRDAALALQQGKKLTAEGKKYYDKYKLVEEYTTVAPTYKGPGKYLYRGLEFYNDDNYGKKILSLKPGDSFDLSKIPSSFSSQENKAKEFATNCDKDKHVILRIPKSKLKHSPSITGLSVYGKAEYEVLVGDYNWTVSKIVTKSFYDSFYKKTYDLTYVYLE